MSTSKHITTTFPQYPDRRVLIALFENVENAAEIKQRVLQPASDADALNYAFISATTVYSIEHLLAAVYRAFVDGSDGQARTKSVHSDIIFSLSPNNNIMDGLRRFGIADNSLTLLAVRVLNPEDDAAAIKAELTAVVRGDETEVSDAALARACAPEVLRKNYKLSSTFDLADRRVTNTALVGALSLRGL
jgi:EKC/KEOPS complex subunit CGI121/TPRKB